MRNLDDQDIEARIADLDERRAKALAMGGEKKIARRQNSGQLNARERLAYLVDEGSFWETGLLGTSGVYLEDRDKTPTDGKIAGYGKINGRDASIVVNDFTVKGASTSATNGKKIGQVKRIATERGMPCVFIGESTGARLPDAMGSRGMGSQLGNDITQFQRMRETPWTAAALGTSFGSSAWLACCSDFAVMRKVSIMAVSSPRLVSKAIGETVDLEALGGWKLHADTTGQIDMFVDTDEEALDAIKTFLSYLPSHHMEAPPEVTVAPGSGEDMDNIHKILPPKRTQVYDVRKVIKAVVDKGSYFELKPRFGKSAVVALTRIDGKSVGVFANNPLHRGGALDTQACAIPSTFRWCPWLTHLDSQSVRKPNAAGRRAVS